MDTTIQIKNVIQDDKLKHISYSGYDEKQSEQLKKSIEAILNYQWDAERNHWIEKFIDINRRIKDDFSDKLWTSNDPDYFTPIFIGFPETQNHYFYHLCILKQFLLKLKK